MRFDSEADALTYSTRHHEFIRDLDWLDPAQRFAVLAVGRYFAVLDVNAFMETGTLSAYNPVLPLVQSEETGMARVRLPHSDDIRCVSANPFRVGQVASGGFDRRLVITDVTALATGEILQVRLIRLSLSDSDIIQGFVTFKFNLMYGLLLACLAADLGEPF